MRFLDEKNWLQREEGRETQREAEVWSYQIDCGVGGVSFKLIRKRKRLSFLHFFLFLTRLELCGGVEHDAESGLVVDGEAGGVGAAAGDAVLQVQHARPRVLRKMG